MTGPNRRRRVEAVLVWSALAFLVVGSGTGLIAQYVHGSAGGVAWFAAMLTLWSWLAVKYRAAEQP